MVQNEDQMQDVSYCDYLTVHHIVYYTIVYKL